MRWLSEAYRLFSFLDAVYFAGNFLMRRSLRYALATLIVSAAGYLGNLIPGVQTYHARVVLLLPICVGLSMQGLGLALRMVPMLFKSRLTGVAQAADLDLMENYRKCNQESHLAALWDRVFRHEWAVAVTPAAFENMRRSARNRSTAKRGFPLMPPGAISSNSSHAAVLPWTGRNPNPDNAITSASISDCWRTGTTAATSIPTMSS